MLKRNYLMIAALLVALLAWTGCSTEKVAAPSATDSATIDTTIPGMDLYTDMNDAEMVASLRQLAKPFVGREISEGGSFHSVQSLFNDLDITTEFDKASDPLPAPLQVVAMAAQGINAVDNGDWWWGLTTYLNDKTLPGFWGFQVAWLGDIPEDPDPLAYYCYYYTDRPVADPVYPVTVTPYSQPIVDSVGRVFAALANPSTISNIHYRQDNYVMFDYLFTYESPSGPHRFEMMKFRLHL